LISRANAAGNQSKNPMGSPSKIQLDSSMLKIDQDDFNYLHKNSKVNTSYEDLNLPLGPIE